MSGQNDSLELLRRAMRLNGDARQLLIDQHPEVLAVQHYRLFADLTHDDPDHESLMELLAELREYIEACERKEVPFGFGSGPIETLWTRVSNGIVSLESAKVSAASFAPAMEAEIYLRALLTMSRRMDAQSAVVLTDLARKANSARPGGALSTTGGIELELAFVRSAGRRLVEEPDGRLARDALAAGELILEHVRKAGDTELELEALISIGALCSNPISAQNSRTNLEQNLYIRQRQFYERHAAELMSLPEELWTMPNAAEMLRRAVQAYGDAAELASGSDRGRSRKAQAISLAYLDALNESMDSDELIRHAEEAIDLIDQHEALSDVVAVLGILTEYGRPPSRSILDQLLATSADRLVHLFGPTNAVELVLNTAVLVRQAVPAMADAAITRARPLVLSHGAARDRWNLWQEEIDSVVATWVPGGYATLRPFGVHNGYKMIEKRSTEESWDPVAVAAATIGIAGLSPNRDEEALGLLLLDEVEAHAPVWAADHAEALEFVRFGLHVGDAVNSVNAAEWAAAIQEYGEAIAVAIRLDVPHQALDVLTRIDTLIAKAGYDGAMHAVVSVGSVALQLENLAGDAATTSVQRIIRHAIGHLLAGRGRGGTNPEALLFALQVAKGLRFASLLISRQRFNWSMKEIGGSLLSEIAELERDLADDQVQGVDHPVDENMMLAASTVFANANDGTTEGPGERLRFMKREFDRRLHVRMLGDASGIVLLGTEALHAAIDRQTVLIDLYIGRTPGGNAALYALGVTNDDIRASTVDLSFPDGFLELGDEQRKVRGSIMTLIVSDLRRSLLEPCEPDDVSVTTAEELRTMMNGYLQGLSTWLSQWWTEGRNHLCFVPHGSLHYLPFHLLPHDGQPLAEKWAVTTLPNRALLLDSRGGATTTMRRQRQLAAFGIGYSEGWHGLRPLRHAITEATAVAEVFGESPIVGADASEDALIDALRTARYVHVAAHGMHDYNAPVFQCLFLAPKGQSDGVLRAYELAEMDLRGTEMVTMSACETALGMIDEADNPRGLPAALLLAGVRCVVGTLWDVRSDTSEYFFTHLYRNVALDRSPQEAFRFAQRETRAAYPVYRDWGAFSLSGIGTR